MPIYEYRCSACGHHLEALQKMSEAALRKCPDCGKAQLRRLMSASRFRLKGGGWYETDFKNKDEKQRNLVEKPGTTDSEPKSATAVTDDAKDAKGVKDATKEVAATKPDEAAKPKPVEAKSSTRKKSPAKAKGAKRPRA